MGVIDLVANAATYIGDVSPYLPRGGVAGIAQSGLGDRCLRPLRLAGRVQPDHLRAGRRWSSTCATTSPTASTTPRRRSVILFVEGFKRPERFLALADRALELGKPIMAVKVGRSDQAQVAAVAHSGSLAGEARVTDAALDAAGVIRCADLDELLETAELVEGMRRTGRSVGRGRTGRGHGLDRRGVAHRRPGAADRASTCRRSPRRRAPRSSPRSRRWATSATRSTRGAPTSRPSAYGAVFEAMAASGAYDVLAHRPRLPVPLARRPRSATANDVALPAPRGDRATGPRSCPSTCR